jgi:hypothetical protein
MNANFKLKRKCCGVNDPELAPGWGSEIWYQEHIKNYVHQREVYLGSDVFDGNFHD